MPNFNGVKVDVASGPRWELALSLIASGEAPVRLGALQLWRDTIGPHATGVIRVTAEVPHGISETAALRVLEAQRKVLDEVAAGDQRLAELLREHGCRWEAVYDYGMGTSLIASEEGD